MVILFAGMLIINGCEGGACQKKAPEGEVVVEETVETITPELSAKAVNISKSLSSALCKRMVECAPGTMTEDDCVSQTTASLNEAQAEKPLDVSDSQLSTCVASIGKGTCEEVLGTEPPAGCEFLK